MDLDSTVLMVLTARMEDQDGRIGSAEDLKARTSVGVYVHYEVNPDLFFSLYMKFFSLFRRE